MSAHILEGFLEMLLTERGAAANTLASYRRDLEDFSGFLARRGQNVRKATAADIQAYIKFLDDTGLKATTQARRLSAIRQFFSYLLGEDIRRDDPSLNIDSPRRRWGIALKRNVFIPCYSFYTPRAFGSQNWSPCLIPLFVNRIGFSSCGAKGTRNGLYR